MEGLDLNGVYGEGEYREQMNFLLYMRVEIELVRVALGVLEGKGGVLCMKRSDRVRHFRGKWCFPGGKIEMGERPEDAVVREFREETGLGVRARGVLGKLFVFVEEDTNLVVYDISVLRVERLEGERSSAVCMCDEHTDSNYLGCDGVSGRDVLGIVPRVFEMLGGEGSKKDDR